METYEVNRGQDSNKCPEQIDRLSGRTSTAEPKSLQIND